MQMYEDSSYMTTKTFLQHLHSDSGRSGFYRRQIVNRLLRYPSISRILLLGTVIYLRLNT